MGPEALPCPDGTPCPGSSPFFPSLAPFPQVSKVSSWPWWASIIHICSVCRLLSNSCSVFENFSRRRCCRGESLKSSIVTYQCLFSRWHDDVLWDVFVGGFQPGLGILILKQPELLIRRFFLENVKLVGAEKIGRHSTNLCWRNEMPSFNIWLAGWEEGLCCPYERNRPPSPIKNDVGTVDGRHPAPLAIKLNHVFMVN